MTLLSRGDRWLATTVFAPLIIKFCFLTRQTPNAVSRLFWFAATLDGLYRAESPFFVGVFMLLSIHMMISASLYADRKTASFLLMRVIALECFIVMLIQGIAVQSLHGTEFWLMVLVAEYAATIRFNTPGQSGGGKTR